MIPCIIGSKFGKLSSCKIQVLVIYSTAICSSLITQICGGPENYFLSGGLQSQKKMSDFLMQFTFK